MSIFHPVLNWIAAVSIAVTSSWITWLALAMALAAAVAWETRHAQR